MANDNIKLNIIRYTEKGEKDNNPKQPIRVTDYNQEISLRLQVESYEKYSDKYEFVWTVNGGHFIVTQTGSALITLKRNYGRSVAVGVTLEEKDQTGKGISTTIGRGLINIDIHGPIEISKIAWLDVEYKKKESYLCGESAYIYVKAKGLQEKEELKAEILIDGKKFSTFQKNDYRYEYSALSATEVYYRVYFSPSFADKVKNEGSVLKIVFDKKILVKEPKQQEIKIEKTVNDTDFGNELSLVVVTAVAGKLNVIENNHNPCKYTKISVQHEIFNGEFSNPVSVVFDETKSDTISSYPMIAGDKKRKVKIKVENLTNTKCTDLLHKPVRHEVLSKSKSNELEVVDVNNGDINFALAFDYSLYTKLFVPFTCIWPTARKDTYELPMPSCRHDKTILIDVIPDVEWQISLKLDAGTLEIPIGKKSKGKSKDGNDKQYSKWSADLIFSASWNDSGNKTAKSPNDFSRISYDRKESVAVSLSSLKELSNESFTLKEGTQAGGEAIVNYLKSTVLNKWMELINTIDGLCNIIGQMKYLVDAATVIEGAANTGATLVEVPDKRKIVTLGIDFPNIELAFLWRAATSETNVGTYIEGSGKGVVLGGKAKFDIFALASLHKGINAFVVAADFLLSLIGTSAQFNLILTASLKFDTRIAYNGATDEGDNRLRLIGELKIQIELKVTNKKKESETMGTENKKSKKNRYTTTTSETTSSETEYGAEGQGSFEVIMDVEFVDTGIDGLFNFWNGEVFVKVYSRQKFYKKEDEDTTKRKTGSKQTVPMTDEEKRKYGANDGTTQGANYKNERVFFEKTLLEKGYYTMYEIDKTPCVNLFKSDNNEK